MTPDRWRRITAVFHEVRGHDAATRAALLDDICADDPGLRFEVEELLRAEEEAGQFGQVPVVALDAPRLEPGTSFGPYQIATLIGAGGMGEVYRAHDTRLDRDVAIKVLSKSMSPDADARLLREARSAAALNHPYVCTIYEVGETEGHAYIAMELVEGKPLDQLIPEGGLPLADIVRYGLQIAEAIAHAHERGIVHRDLKPANTMIAPSGIAKVLDFGLAKVLPLADRSPLNATTNHTVAGFVLGTAGYMSPEQVLGHTTDERSDIFSFGVLLYEMASGRPPFGGVTPMEVLDAVLHAVPESLELRRKDLPAGLLHVIDKALSKTSSGRYQHMSQLIADMRRLGEPTSRMRRSVRTTMLAGIAVITVLIGIGITGVIDTASLNRLTESRRRGTASPAAYRAITEARGLYASLRWEAALESAQRALDLDPDYADAWALLGKIYIRGFATSAGFPGGSLEDYRSRGLAAARRAVALDPASNEAYVALALAHREMKQTELSRAAARKAIELDPRHPDAYGLMGDSYLENPTWGCHPDRDMTVALSYYEQARSLNLSSDTGPLRSAPSYVDRSYQMRLAGNIDEALRLVDEAFSLYPTSRALQRTRAGILIDLGRIDEAERMLKEAIADGGSRGDDNMNLAAIDLNRGRLERAADRFKKVDSRRFLNIARYYIKAGHSDPAAGYLEAVLRAEPVCAQWLLATKSGFWTPIRANPQARGLLEKYNAGAPSP